MLKKFSINLFIIVVLLFILVSGYIYSCHHMNYIFNERINYIMEIVGGVI